MKVSYFPGCTLKTKAKDLDVYARKCAEFLGVTLEEIENSAVAFLLLVGTKSQPNFLRCAHSKKQRAKINLWFRFVLLATT